MKTRDVSWNEWRALPVPEQGVRLSFWMIDRYTGKVQLRQAVYVESMAWEDHPWSELMNGPGADFNQEWTISAVPHHSGRGGGRGDGWHWVDALFSDELHFETEAEAATIALGLLAERKSELERDIERIDVRIETLRLACEERQTFILYDGRACDCAGTGSAQVLVACDSDEEARGYRGDFGAMACYSYVVGDDGVELLAERWEWDFWP